MDGKHWRIVAASARGASHLRSGLPNQDAVAWSAAADRGLPIAVAVSDGHGSAKCFRSDAGSRFAVDLTANALRTFAERHPPDSATDSIRGAAESLPKEVVELWRSAVENELKAKALSSDELDALERHDGAASRRAVEANPLLAYGATLLGVLITRGFALYLQLGDGDILCVGDDGAVARPICKDERLIANETTSLCLPEAWRAARVEVQSLASAPPMLIMVSTDGYSNSFADDAGFLQVGSDVLGLVKSEGLDEVGNNLEGWLTETSRGGSGDDITVAIICRQEERVAAAEATAAS